ncbi:MAG TPA: ABC transporter substrate-binding protein [Rhizobiaceae bacterium]|nr:ABC transporter substrate-binding protein [Rhizobiaceae bacterium]
MRCGLAFLLFAALVAPAAADTVIGVAAPLSGPPALLGEQISGGATLAAAAQTPPVTLQVIDDGCTAEGGAAAANTFAAAKVTAVVGFLCTEAIEAALPILKDAGIPVIAVGVRSDSLTDRRHKTKWPVWRLGPRADAERTAAGDILVREWRNVLFAIIDDGTIYGRELAETLRAAAELAALKPVFVDTFRPQLENQIALAGRLNRAGATHVFAGGDVEDIAVLGRDAAQLNAGLVIAGGEALRAAPGPVPLAAGTLMVGLPEWAEVAPADVVQRFEQAEATADGYALPAYAAIEVAAAAANEAAASGKPIAGVLTEKQFATAIGPVDFDDKGDLTASPYRLFRFDGTKFIEVK